MPSTAFDTKRAARAPDVIAADGSEVRVLCGLPRGTMAVFTLGPQQIARPIAHRTVEEVWYILSGRGRMWRKLGDQEALTELAPGLSLTIPCGARFQFRCDGPVPLAVVAVTMPPWPGESEAYATEGKWQPTV